MSWQRDVYEEDVDSGSDYQEKSSDEIELSPPNPSRTKRKTGKGKAPRGRSEKCDKKEPTQSKRRRVVLNKAEKSKVTDCILAVKCEELSEKCLAGAAKLVSDSLKLSVNH